MLNLIAEFKQAAITTSLRRCPAFSGLSPGALDALTAVTVTKSLRKGEYLFLEGGAAQAFFVVQFGAIKLHRTSWSGHEQVIHIYRASESFAEESVFSEAGYAADAMAAEDSRILVIQKAGFLGVLRSQPELAGLLLRSLSQRVRSLMGLLQDLTLKDTQTRLGDWLIQHCPDPHSRGPQQIFLPMTKRVLASELGVTSETLSRTLLKFRNEHMVDVRGRTLTVTSPVRLAAFLHVDVAPGNGKSHAPVGAGQKM